MPDDNAPSILSALGPDGELVLSADRPLLKTIATPPMVARRKSVDTVPAGATVTVNVQPLVVPPGVKLVLPAAVGVPVPIKVTFWFGPTAAKDPVEVNVIPLAVMVML